MMELTPREGETIEGGYEAPVGAARRCVSAKAWRYRDGAREFNRRGYDRIAARGHRGGTVGVGEATFHHYVASKDDILSSAT